MSSDPEYSSSDSFDGTSSDCESSGSTSQARASSPEAEIQVGVQKQKQKNTRRNYFYGQERHPYTNLERSLMNHLRMHMKCLLQRRESVPTVV